MKLKQFRALVALAPLALLLGCGAQSGNHSDKAQAPAEKKAGMEASHAAGEGTATAEMITCPVSGHQVAKDQAFTIEYEGKKVSFCCADCEEPFRADPAKYMAALEGAPAPEAGEAKEAEHTGH